MTRGRQSVWLQRVLVGLAVISLGGLVPVARGCPYGVRDAGFIVREATPYELYVFVADRTPRADQLPRWLTAASTKWLAEANIEAEVVNTERQTGHEGMSYYRKLGSPAVPTAILVSPRDRTMILPAFDSNGVSEPAVDRLVRRVVSSPCREEIADYIVKHWGVILLVKGTDQGENELAQEVVAAAANAIVGTRTEMGGIVKLGPYVTTVSGQDVAEQVLLWSLELDKGNRTRAAVLFGMERRLGPVLEGDDLTEAQLLNLLRLLGRNCTCTTDPTWLLGPAAPLVWGVDRQTEVLDEMGFDPNSPAVASTLAGVWTTVGETGRLRETAQTGARAPRIRGYMEFALEPEPTDEEASLEGESAETDLGVPEPSEAVSAEPPVVSKPAEGGAVAPPEEDPNLAERAAPAPEPVRRKASASTVDTDETEKPTAEESGAPAEPAAKGASNENAEMPAAPTQPTGGIGLGDAGASSLEQRSGRMLLVFGLILAVFGLVGGALLVWHRHRGA